MNLKKMFFWETWLAVLIFAVFIFTLTKMKDPAVVNWFIITVHLIMLWSIYYFTFIRTAKELKLDERENFIYTKSGHLSSFIFMSFLLILYLLQNNPLPIIKIEYKFLWGWFLLPIYILIHGLSLNTEYAKGFKK